MRKKRHTKLVREVQYVAEVDEACGQNLRTERPWGSCGCSFRSPSPVTPVQLNDSAMAWRRFNASRPLKVQPFNE
jgi:hypothetical protein